MGRFIGGLLSNDSTFGRIMTRLGIIIGANLVFMIFSIPVVTIGPGLAALYYVMLKTLKDDSSLNPFKTFWQGFKMNFKQGIIAFLIFAAAGALLVLDIRFCSYAGGVLTVFKYACYCLLFFGAILAVYIQPVMAAFSDTLPHLLRNALFFAARRPLKMILALAVYAVPIAVTVIDTRYRPLYGFIWVMLGFGLITMMVSELLIKDIEEFLPSQDEEGEKVSGDDAARKPLSERKLLKEMKKLDK